jgi:hypothetical protein
MAGVSDLSRCAADPGLRRLEEDDLVWATRKIHAVSVYSAPRPLFDAGTPAAIGGSHSILVATGERWLRWSFGQPGLPQSFFISTIPATTCTQPHSWGLYGNARTGIRLRKQHTVGEGSALADGLGAGLEPVEDLQGALVSGAYNSSGRSIKGRAEMFVGFCHAILFQ